MPVFHHGGPGAIGWTVFALELLLVLGVGWLVVSTLLRRRPAPAAVAASSASRREAALETLQLRYARGEIDRDAYLQARSDLGAESPPPDA